MSGKETILIVDDEPEICELLSDYLHERGFNVLCVDQGEKMYQIIRQQPVDVILLDINLPGADGLSLAKDLRALNHKVGIIMVTGSGEVIDKVVGLEMGADDYIVKPFVLREVLARIKSVLRRYQVEKSESESPNKAAKVASNTVRFGEFILDMNRRELLYSDGAAFPVTAMEFDLLRVFAEHPNRVLSRDQILDMTQNREWYPFDRSVDIRIARLRRKIQTAPGEPQIIRTVRGAGYMYVPGQGN